MTGPAPTLLYAYGGFNISITPGLLADAASPGWSRAGCWRVANIRGGGEYGKAWHDGGRLANKQNVFDDFIAAGEYLKSEWHHRRKDGSAIRAARTAGCWSAR